MTGVLLNKFILNDKAPNFMQKNSDKIAYFDYPDFQKIFKIFRTKFSLSLKKNLFWYGVH